MVIFANGAKFVLPRRFILKASLGIGALFVAAPELATAQTGIQALDTPAIPVKVPDGVLLVAIAFAGKRLVAVGEHGVIIYSDDSGVTWTQAAVPVDVSLTCVQFANPLIGWAAGHFGVILKTADGGKTWQTQLNGLQVNQLTLAAAQDATAQNSTVPGAAYAVRRANAFVNAGPNRPFLSLLVFSPDKVIAFGAYKMTMLTNDGGKTWVDWSLHIYEALSKNIYGVTRVGDIIYAVGEAGLVLASKDDGNTFLPTPPTEAVTLFGLIGGSDGSIIIYGVAGNAFRSTDNGNTWNVVNLPTADDLTVAITLKSGTILIASEVGSLFLSKDNGVTFALASNGQPISIFDVAEAATGELVIVGGGGVVRVPEQRLNT